MENSQKKLIRVWYPDRVETLTPDEFRACSPINVVAVKEWTRGLAYGPLLHHTKTYTVLPPGDQNVKSFNLEDLKGYLTRNVSWLKWGVWLDELEWRRILKEVESDTWTPSA
jgi:hypothetical protein